MNTPSVHAENAVPLLFESQVSCRLDLARKRTAGLFGKPAAQLDVAQPFTDKCGGVGYSSNMLLFGFVAYYEQTGDLRSLQAACGMVEFILTRKDLYREWLGARKGKPCIEMWITHPLARLYRITGDRRYLDLCATIRDSFDRIEGTHSHGPGTTLRGLDDLCVVRSGSTGTSWESAHKES